MHAQPVKRNRLARILMGVFFPVLIQTVLLLIYTVIDSGVNAFRGFEHVAKLVLFYIVYGYVITGLQSLVYALLMEFIVNANIENHISTILASGLLGLLSGLSVILILTGGNFTDIEGWLLMSTVTGLFMGIILRRNYHRSRKKITSI